MWIQKIIAVFLIWEVALVATKIMKKIEPTNKIYPVWALSIAAMYTALAIVG